MTEPTVGLDLRELRRMPLAMVLTLILQTGAGLLWAGSAAERITVLEQRLDRAGAGDPVDQEQVMSAAIASAPAVCEVY